MVQDYFIKQIFYSIFNITKEDELKKLSKSGNKYFLKENI